MVRRSYGQFCAVAHALDAVGERWTLLVVRELLTGPKRFTDLLDGLPGIGTNLLSARLRHLEELGVVGRERLPPPAAATVYVLTASGHELEPVVHALSIWGRRFLGPPGKGEVFRPGWLLLSLRYAFRPRAAKGVRDTYEYRVDDDVFQVRVAGGEADVRQGTHWRPDVVIHADVRTLLDLGTGTLSAREARRSGRVRLEGDPKAFTRSTRLFRVDLEADR